jgi:hypothetical protein
MAPERQSDDAPAQRHGGVFSKKQSHSRRTRSIAIALALGALAILFYAVTVVKGPAVLNRPL